MNTTTTNTPEPKYCKDCAHGEMRDYPAKCAAVIKNVSLVHGPQRENCTVARGDGAACGVDALLFSPRAN